MNERPKVQTEAGYGLAEALVAIQSGVPPGAILPAIMMHVLSEGRRGRLEIIQLRTDDRKRRGLQAECAKVSELAELSKLPYEEFAELVGMVEHEIHNMQTV